MDREAVLAAFDEQIRRQPPRGSVGLRYLQVDASADSRPILRRLGFVELAETTPYTLPTDLD